MKTQRRQAGISTGEFVAVVAIIAIVALVALPVFVRTDSRSGTQRSNCQSNLKECALAVQLYWGDYDATLPSSALVSHSDRWNRPNFRTFATTLGRLPQTGARRTWGEILYDKMKNKDIVFCPSDPIDRRNPKSVCSYWWKTAIDKAWFGVGCQKPCRQEGDFAYNADVIMLYEHKGWHFGDASGLKNGVSINVAFMDTHVKTISLTNATSGDPINCAANSDGEPMYFNFDNTKPEGKGNPPPKGIPARHVDPGRYSDTLP